MFGKYGANEMPFCSTASEKIAISTPSEPSQPSLRLPRTAYRVPRTA